jgi:hypothetical protein
LDGNTQIYMLGDMIIKEQGDIPTNTLLVPKTSNKACSLLLEAIQVKELQGHYVALLEQEERDWVDNMINQNWFYFRKLAYLPPSSVIWKLPMEEEDFLRWKQEQNKFFLFFDGAMKGAQGWKAWEGSLLILKEMRKTLLHWDWEGL